MVLPPVPEKVRELCGGGTTSMREVPCPSAGVSPTAVYHHFEDRDALAQAAPGHDWPARLDRASKSPQSTGSSVSGSTCCGQPSNVPSRRTCAARIRSR